MEILSSQRKEEGREVKGVCAYVPLFSINYFAHEPRSFSCGAARSETNMKPNPPQGSDQYSWCHGTRYVFPHRARGLFWMSTSPMTASPTAFMFQSFRLDTRFPLSPPPLSLFPYPRNKIVWRVLEKVWRVKNVKWVVVFLLSFKPT